MNSEVRSYYRCFRRVQEYLAAHQLADAPATLGKQANELNEVVEQLTRESLDQEAGYRLTKAQTQHQRELRQQLWELHMLPVSRVARDVFGLEGVDRALKLPHVQCPTERLVAAAGAMAEAAGRQPQPFIDHGLDAGFVAALRSATAELANALGARDGTQRRRVEATRRIDELVKRGRRALRLLNAVLRPRLAGDAAQLSAWDNVRAVKEVGGGSVAPPVVDPLKVEAA